MKRYNLQNLNSESSFIDILRTFTNISSQTKTIVSTLDPFEAFIILHDLINVNRHQQQQNTHEISAFLESSFLILLDTTESLIGVTSSDTLTRESNWKISMEQTLDA